MNHRRSPFSILAASITLLCAAGCFAPPSNDEPRGHLKFDPPRMPLVPPPVPTPVDAALQQRARDEIAVALNASDPVTRAQALEASSRTKDPAAADRVVRALADKEPLVRYAGAMCAGDLKLGATRPALLAAAYDADPSVRVAVRYALHRLGDKSLTKDLEPLSQNPDPRVRANVAVAIGLLGEPSGVRVVRPLVADKDAAVRIQAAEALWRLGDEQGLKNLIAGTISPFPDDQILSVLALAGPRDQRVKDNVEGKLAIDKDGRQYVELQLAAARAMGMLGSDAGYGVAIAQATSLDGRRRALAALALGEIGRPDAQPALTKLIADPNADVRLAAATAVRQIGVRAKA